MGSLKLPKKAKLAKNLEDLGMEYIKTFELNNGQKVYLFKKDFKYFLLDKKGRNKFLPQEGIYEDNTGTSFYIEKDIDGKYYLRVDLSGVNLYFDKNGEKYRPKSPLESTKKALFHIISDFINNKLGFSTIFAQKTIKAPKYPKNNNINYKK